MGLYDNFLDALSLVELLLSELTFVRKQVQLSCLFVRELKLLGSDNLAASYGIKRRQLSCLSCDQNMSSSKPPDL